MDRVVLPIRFSGGAPSADGGFSGVARNSYCIEKGEIEHPVKEMMISGNIRDMLMNISVISYERVTFGYAILPWVRAGGISVFGT